MMNEVSSMATETAVESKKTHKVAKDRKEKIALQYENIKKRQEHIAKDQAAIKKSQLIINQLEREEEQEKIAELTLAIKEKGVSIEDVVKAVAAGNIQKE